MYLRNAADGTRNQRVGRQAARGMEGAAPRPVAHRVRGVIAGLAAFALVMLGASPALAEGEAPAAEVSASEQSLETPVTEAPAPPEQPAPPVEVSAPAAPVPEAPAPPAAPEPAVASESSDAGVEDQAGSSTTETDASETGATGDGAALAATAVAPAPPYLHFIVTDASGALLMLPGITVALQGPGDAAVDDAEGWAQAPTSTVLDNAGEADYVGADLDARPGHFTVKQLANDADLSQVHEVGAAEKYRVRASAADGYLVGDAASWIGLDAVDDDAAAQQAENTPVELRLVSDSGDKSPAEPIEAVKDDQLEGEVGLLLVGEPEALAPPYLYWNLEKADGSALAGASFLIAAGTGANNWGSSVTVTDCVVTAPAVCSGLDLDPEAGEFQVKYLGSGTSNPVVAGARYRVTQSVIPSGYLADSVRGSGTNGWQTVAAGAWNQGDGADTHDFGSWVNLTTLAAGSARIVVKVGGDRSGASTVSGLAGVVMHLQLGNDSGPNGTRGDGVAGDGAGWARCVSDANGDCAFTVPNTGIGGSNRNDRFWVVAYAAPSGWYLNQNLRTGGSAGSGDNTPYRFRTGSSLVSGSTYTSTSNFMSTESGSLASSGNWQVSLSNPSFPGTCGVDVALVLDLSGSVGGSIGALKDAANAFTNALVSTQSRMALFSFGPVSPKSGTTNYPTLTPVTTQEQADAFKARYSGWSAEGGTNWDRGLAVPAASNTGSNHYEVVVVITDGNPTNYGTTPSGNGSSNRLIEAEQGVFSANQLKAQGSRMLVFGVGAGATGATNALNLRAISGPTAYNGSNAQTADYYQTSDYAAVGQQLKALAQGSCAGNVTVTKKVVPNTNPPGSIANAALGVAGWTFTTSNPGAGLTLPTPPARTTTDDGTGTVTFPLTFATGAPAELTVTETQQSGYTLQQVGGNNAVCTNQVTGAGVSVTNVGALGFKFIAPPTELVNCVVYNRAPDQTSTVRVDKTWVVNDGTGVPKVYNGNENLQPAGMTAQLRLTPPQSTTLENWTWGAVRANYPQNSTVKIGEVAAINDDMLPGCQLVSQQVTGWDKGGPGFVPVDISVDPFSAALPSGPNVFAVTNTVTCGQTLELVKVVDFGSEEADSWTLSGTNSAPGVLPGPSGQYTAEGSVKSQVTVDAAYLLGETGGPAQYMQTAAGWRCIDQQGEVIDLAEGAVSVGLGQQVVCTVHNTTAELTVFKNVEGGNAVPNSWDITGQPAGGVEDLPTAEWQGTSSPAGVPSGGPTVEVLPNHNYTLSEALAAAGTPLAYLLTHVQQWDPDGGVGGLGAWVDVSSADLNAVTVAVAPGEHAYYRFINSAAPAVTVPLTGGMSGDLFSGGGIALAALAVLMGVFYWRRIRRQAEVR